MFPFLFESWVLFTVTLETQYELESSFVKFCPSLISGHTRALSQLLGPRQHRARAQPRNPSTKQKDKSSTGGVNVNAVQVTVLSFLDRAFCAVSEKSPPSPSELGFCLIFQGFVVLHHVPVCGPL